MALPALPAGWPRIVAWLVGILLVSAAVVYAVPQAKSAVVNWMIQDREAALRAEIATQLQPQIEQAQKEQEAARLEAEEWRKRAARLGQEVAQLNKERQALKPQVAQAGVAREQAREEASHVVDAELLPRIRTSLARLRRGPGG